MFGQYTEKAKQTIHSAKHEADKIGSPEINSAHILLGLLKDAVLAEQVLRDVSLPQVREEILARQPQQSPRLRSGDLPLSPEAKQTLMSAAEEARKSGSRYVANGHILLGLLRAESSYVAEMLRQKGILVENVRAQIESVISRESSDAERQIAQTTGIQGANQPTIQQKVWDLAKREGGRQGLKLVDDLLAEPGRDKDSTIRELWFTATILSRKVGDLELVKHYCQELLARDPEEPLAFYVLADCLEQQDRHEEAKRYAAKSYAIVSRPSSKARDLLDLLTDRWPELKEIK